MSVKIFIIVIRVTIIKKDKTVVKIRDKYPKEAESEYIIY